MEATTEKSKKTRGLEPKATRTSEAKTEKIKVKVNVAPRYKEVEVSFPYYVQDGCVFIKFFDKNKGIMISDYPFFKNMQYMDMPEDWITYEPTTEDTFNMAFNKVMNFLIKSK